MQDRPWKDQYMALTEFKMLKLYFVPDLTLDFKFQEFPSLYLLGKKITSMFNNLRNIVFTGITLYN